jgi:hypothetical protein
MVRTNTAVIGREVAIHDLTDVGDFAIQSHAFDSNPEDVITSIAGVAADGDRYELAVLSTYAAGNLLFENFGRARSALERLGVEPTAGLDIMWATRPFAFFDIHLAVYVSLQRLGILHPRLANASGDTRRLAEVASDPWPNFGHVFAAAWPGTGLDLANSERS